MKEGKTITVNKRKLELTNLQKVYWPEENITKGDMIDYYEQMYRLVLPYLKGRPQSLKRNPNGIHDKGFFQKDAGGDAPEWVRTEKIYADSSEREVNYIICDDKATLLYLANLGCIELNPWNSKVSTPDNPDFLILDLDPSDKNDYDDVVEVALAIKSVLEKAGISSYCKTSGKSGMHIYLPLAGQYDYEEVRSFAKLLATLAQAQIPDKSTLERSLASRPKNKVYIDFLQNAKGQTLASPYCLRPYPGATVSTPLEWKEIKPGLRPDKFTIRTVPQRVEKIGDLFKGVLGKGLDMEKSISKLEK